MNGLDKNYNNERGEDIEIGDFDIVKKDVESHIGEITSFEKIPRGSNEIFYIETEKGKFILKVYNKNCSQRTNESREIYISGLLKNLPEIRKMIFSDATRKRIPHEFAVFEYVEGQTLRSLVEADFLSEEQTENVADQVFAFIQKVTQIPTREFGQLDDNEMKGTSKSWVDFLVEMQEPTTKTFNKFGNLATSIYLAPQRILNKHKDKFKLEKSKLIPMDLNIDNIVITPDSKVRFIDSETFWSGDPLCAYSQFYALTKGTPLGEKFISKLSLSSEDGFKMRFYALLDNLNVLAYITRIDPKATKKARPWGNPNKFIDLIQEHIDYLETEI